MLSTREIQDIATQIRAAQIGVHQIEPITQMHPEFDLPSAYAVAKIIHDTRVSEGYVPVGRKIGFTNPAMWDIYGVREPIWAYVYDKTVMRLEDNKGVCRISGFTEPKIEPEIAFCFRSTPPAGADLQTLLGCIDWVTHSFEIVQSHFPQWKFQSSDTVADGSLHGMLLLGDPVPVNPLDPDPVAALESFSVSLLQNGELRETGGGANVLGNPLAALTHLMAVLSRQPESMPLQAGEIVTTGTITPARTIRAGEVWQAKIDEIALPDLEVVMTI